MSKNYLLIAFLLLLSACSHEQKDIDNTIIDKIVLLTPGNDTQNTTRVSMLPDNNNMSLALICRWQNSDQIHFFGFQNLDYYRTMDMGNLYVENISEDGKKCEFSVKRPDSFEPIAPYTVYGVCGKESQLINNKVYVYGNLIRSSFSNFNAPIWFKGDVGLTWPDNITCKHMGTYEVLHIKNNTNQPIVFKWVGYDTEEPWYYENVAYIPETDELVENGSPVTDKSPADAIVKIPAGEDGILISWFIPNGRKMKDAALLATIDGIDVVSASRKSSSLTIEKGQAYHLYANWDGTTLHIDTYTDSGLTLGEVINHDL